MVSEWSFEVIRQLIKLCIHFKWHIYKELCVQLLHKIRYIRIVYYPMNLTVVDSCPEYAYRIIRIYFVKSIIQSFDRRMSDSKVCRIYELINCVVFYHIFRKLDLRKMPFSKLPQTVIK